MSCLTSFTCCTAVPQAESEAKPLIGRTTHVVGTASQSAITRQEMFDLLVFAAGGLSLPAQICHTPICSSRLLWALQCDPSSSCRCKCCMSWQAHAAPTYAVMLQLSQQCEISPNCGTPAPCSQLCQEQLSIAAGASLLQALCVSLHHLQRASCCHFTPHLQAS